MAVAVNDLTAKASLLLQDASNVRWAESELVDWLNEGIRTAIDLKPDLGTVRVSMDMVSGSVQAVPEDVQRVIRFEHDGLGNAVTPTTRHLLDAFIPGWMGTVAGTAQGVRHVVTDDASDTTFYVYPPNDGTGTITALVVQLPAAVSAGGSSIPLPDDLGDALVDYMVGRACMKDLAIPGMMAKAQAHQQAFLNRLGIEATADAALNPETPARDPAV